MIPPDQLPPDDREVAPGDMSLHVGEVVAEPGHRERPPQVAVLAPLLFLSVTIESDGEGDAVHLHPGGQGYWIARMIQSLGVRTGLVAPLGGEVGLVLPTLVAHQGLELVGTSMGAGSPSYVHDRRSGERSTVAVTFEPILDRHEMDDLYGAILHAAIAAGTCVLTGGSPGVLSARAYTRLGSDLARQSVTVVADMHGEALGAFLEGGPIGVLKVSHEDLVEDGWADDSEDAMWGAARTFAERGVETVVVSRADRPAFVVSEGHRMMIRPPELETADHRGAGDSMTGGMTAGLVRGLDRTDVLRLGAACAAGNVTRHGLGSGAPELVETLAPLVEIERLGDGG